MGRPQFSRGSVMLQSGTSCGCEMAMDECNGRCALADRAAHPLHGARANVTYGEQPGNVRFEWRGNAFGRLRNRRCACEHEAVRVERDVAVSKPFGFRVGAGEQEEVTDVAPLFDPR